MTTLPRDVTPRSTDALGDWFALRGDRPEDLFLPITRHGRIVGARMTSHAVYTVLAKRQARAGGRSSPRMTSGAPSSATCSTRGLTSRRRSSWPATPA
ncbi:MAG: hypothetical protein M3Q65_20845 [Chloroflexota bacterium]|nr:hypothetical protein [Chloroflexota bacterium]